MKIRVSSVECAGHSQCNLVNPALFPLDDDGFSAIGEVRVPDGLEGDARRGVQFCPAQAIAVTES